MKTESLLKLRAIKGDSAAAETKRIKLRFETFGYSHVDNTDVKKLKLDVEAIAEKNGWVLSRGVMGCYFLPGSAEAPKLVIAQSSMPPKPKPVRRDEVLGKTRARN